MKLIVLTTLPQFYYKKNRLQQLKGFCFTAELGSISEAAKKMGLNQPTVTLQIQSLEKDLKLVLFERKVKPLKLTESGKMLYNMAIYHLEAIDGLYEEFLLKKSFKNSSRIEIAAHHSVVSYMLPKYVTKFLHGNSDITMAIKNIAPNLALQKLREGELDFIIYPNLDFSEEFFVADCGKFDPVLVMKKDHPLAKIKNIKLENIAKYDLIKIDQNLAVSSLFEEIFREFKFKTNIDFENASWGIIKQYIKSGAGIGFTSSLCLIEQEPELIYKKLNEYVPEIKYKIIFKRGRYLSQTVRNFISLINPDFILDLDKFHH